MFFESSSQPRRVLTVTGRRTASTIRRVISTIFGTSRIMPLPAPRPAILRTGQPKLMSIRSGPCRLGHPRRLDHRFDLDGRRAGCPPAARSRTVRSLATDLGRVADQPVARNELRVDHVRSETSCTRIGTTDRSRLPSARETEACRPNRFRQSSSAQKYEKDSFPPHPGTERYASRSVPERYSRRLSDADRFRTRSPVPGNRPHGTCGQAAPSRRRQGLQTPSTTGLRAENVKYIAYICSE